jgi:predicted NAD-dependent protein-ADP-ribosyltransferase YbiA (DUF1768 family)
MKIVQFFSRSRDVGDLDGCPKYWRKYLSNFTMTSNYIEIYGRKYASPEHAFQGLKTRLCSNAPESYNTKFECDNNNLPEPKDAKRAGGKGMYRKHNITLDIDKWDAVRVDIMEEVLRARMKSDTLFINILRQTKKDDLFLIHFENSRGRGQSFWGGSYNKETRIMKGDNMLGVLMMYLRDNVTFG